MKTARTAKKTIINTSYLLFSLTLIFTLLVSVAYLNADSDREGEHGKPLALILEGIRAKQGLGPDEAIDPRKVNNEDLEELGEAVMSVMIPDEQQHELMDQMMGGEGSWSLARMHRRMGYNYLSGGGFGMHGMFGGRRGFRGGMMGQGMM